jgi:glycosyltransferase involved in cell wall biosynthesis
MREPDHGEGVTDNEGGLSKYITVGMPLYRGKTQVADALRSLQAQTFTNFEVIISVDGADEDSAEACRPFLADPRFRMVVHPERLDWFGNFNWLLQQPMGDFFCYRQHDDTTAPEFFEKLIEVAHARPDAAAVYADCQWQGGRSDLESAPSIEGDTLHRLRQFIEQKEPVAVRGLIRRAAVAQAGLVRGDEFRALSEVFVWLAKVLRWGSFVRVPEPLYYRLDHEANYHKQWFEWSDNRKRASWTTMFTGLLEAVLPACSSAEERLFFEHFILDRISVYRSGQTYHYAPRSPHDAGVIIAECFERLSREGHLDHWIVPETLTGPMRQLLKERDRLVRENESLSAENDLLHRSRALAITRAVRRLLGLPYI